MDQLSSVIRPGSQRWDSDTSLASKPITHICPACKIFWSNDGSELVGVANWFHLRPKSNEVVHAGNYMVARTNNLGGSET